MSNEWRAIPGYEGVYEVSDAGNVRRVGRTHGATAGRVMTRVVNRSGYWVVTLSKSQDQHKAFVHRLVASAFIGPCPDGHEVNHRDGDRLNASAANLEYVTRTQNIIHGRGSLGWNPSRGETRPGAKLTVADVLAIRQSPLGQRALARQYGVVHKTIAKIQRGEKWAHVEAQIEQVLG